MIIIDEHYLTTQSIYGNFMTAIIILVNGIANMNLQNDKQILKSNIHPSAASSAYCFAFISFQFFGR